MLSIHNLHASVNGREILKGISLDVKAGEVHAIMGPNGSGKSTLAGVLAGREAYEVTQGTVEFLGKDLLEMAPEERARDGIFLAFQYPVEIPGVSNTYFLRAAVNAVRKHRDQPELDAAQFLAVVKEKVKILHMDPELLKRPVNEGFSGGEKKRNEIFQMAVLDPKLAILDETDSGLDIDALRVVSEGVNALRSPDRAVIVVTHYQRLLNYIVPDRVHVLFEGRIVKSGGKELALKLKKEGYGWIEKSLAQSVEKEEGIVRIMIAVQEEKNVYRSNFSQLERELAMGSSGRMRSLRKEALGLFEELGFPTVRNEDWKFTNLASLAKVPFKPASPPVAGELSLASLEQATLPLASAQRLVFLNGTYSPELSRVDRMPKGVVAMSLAQAIAENPDLVDTYLARQVHFRDHAFTALNTAFLRDGAFVHVPRGIVVREPLYLISATSCAGEACVIHPRNLILADENSQLTLVEYFAALEEHATFTNAVTEIVAGPNSVIDHYKVQRENLESFHIATSYVEMARASTFSSHLVSLGGALVRNDIRSRLGAEGCVCTLNGLYLGSGRQHVDSHTEIDHAFPNCQSHELYKGILDDHAHGVFNGKIFVRQDAQKTDAKQTNQTLLLSDTAVIDTKPQLEIFADDVKCTHGATVGQLSDEAIFYLRSRGIGLQEARSLLTFAFANDIVRRIQVEPIRAQLQDVLLVRQHLPAAEEAS